MEIWKPVVGYEWGYEVSNLGRVRSIDRVVVRKGDGANCHYTGKLLTPTVDTAGYFHVKITKRNKMLVHHMVAKSFLGARPAGHDIHHKNDNKLDSRLENLEYKSELDHAHHHNNPGKLTREAVRQIRELYSSGKHPNDLADTFGVTYSTIRRIINRQTWKISDE